MRLQAPLLLAIALLASGTAAAADLDVAVYGDIGYGFSHEDGYQNAFATPRVEPFVTASADRLRFLVEPLFEVNQEPFNPAFNSITVDVERLQLSYDFADAFRLTGGRFHTPFGYYNDAYHHGVYFMMTEDRPEMVEFEDSGGLIPAHSVGVMVDGRLPLGKYLAVRYDASVANNRNPVADAINLRFDSRTAKAVCLRLRLEPAGALDGLIVGGNFYWDTIDAGDPPAAPFALRETTWGAHVAYLEHNVQFVTEGMLINHRELDGPGRLFQVWAFFGELGYTFGDFTPYARFERTLYTGPEIDPFFASQLSGLEGSHATSSVGTRYLVNDHLVLKLEGSLTHHDSGAPTAYLGRLQAAFAF